MTNLTNPFGNPQDEQDLVFEIDLSEETGSSTIPEGEYIGKLIDLEKTTSKAGNPMWTWDFTIVEGEYSGMDFRLFTALTPSALWKLAETLEALGIGGFGKSVKFSPEDVLNTMVVLHIRDDDYNGQVRSQLDKITAHPKGAGIKHQSQEVPQVEDSPPSTSKPRKSRKKE